MTEAETTLTPTGTQARPQPRVPETSRVLAWLVAAAAIAAIAAAVAAIRQSNSVNHLAVTLGAGNIEQVAQQADLNPVNTHYELFSADRTDRVDVVVTPKRWGFVTGAKLPAASSGHEYQLWGLTKGQAGPADKPPISLGLIGPDPSVAAFRMPAGITDFAISVESQNGATAPTGDFLATGRVTSQPDNK